MHPAPIPGQRSLCANAVDLATLDAAATQVFTRSQRMRFMHIYLGHNRLTDKDKQLIQQVLERARPMRERQLKRLERSIAADENGKPDILPNQDRPGALLFSGYTAVTCQKNRVFISKPPKFLQDITTSGHPHGYAG